MIREIALSNSRHFHSDTNVPLLRPLRRFVSEATQEPGGFDFINFYGGPSSISSVSLATLLSPHTTPDEAYFRDRVVLIGIATEARTGIAAGKDTFVTSYSDRPIYGVEVHATIAANLLDGSWIRRLPLLAEGLAMGGLAFFISYTLLLSGPFLGLAVAAVWFCVSYLAFTTANLFLPGLTVFLVVIVFAVFFLWGIKALRRLNSDDGVVWS